MAAKIQLRRDTASVWTSVNPTLALGEPGVETDTYKVKVGDGATAWTSLPYTITTQFTDLNGKPTTIAGYGIADAYTKAQVDAIIESPSGNLTGSVFADDSTIMVDGVAATLNFANNSITDLNDADQTVQTTDNVTFSSVTGNVITTQIDSGDSSAIEIQTDVDMLAGLTVGNHIVPSSNENIDLGSASARFRDLYLSGNSAVIGDLALKRHASGGLLVSDHSTGNPTNVTTHNITANDITAAGNVDVTGNLTMTGYIAGPAVFTIDPAAVGDNTGTVVIAGDLQVDGTQTTINSTTLDIDDKNITLSVGSPNSAGSDGAGITVDNGSDTDAEIKYSGTNDAWEFNKDVGIGTNNPGSPLQVESATDYLANFKSSDTTAGVKFTDLQSQGRILTANGHLVLIADANNAVGSSSVRFNLDTTSIAAVDSSMILTNTGLGIGVVSPSEALDVSGNIGVTGTVDGVDIQTLNTTAGAALPKAGGTMTGDLQLYKATPIITLKRSDNATLPGLSWQGSGGAEAASIKLDGTSGTTNSLVMSTYNGSTMAERLRLMTSAAGGIAVTGTISVTGTVDGVDIAARDAILTSTTTTAGAALPKAGGTMTGTLNVTQASTADTIKLTRGTTAHNNMIKFVTGSTDKWIVGQRNDSTDHFRFYSYGTSSDVLSIQTDGNVGIGTADPAGQLHIMSGDAGTVTPSSQADDLVVEASTEGGITIMTPDDQSARIRFTSPSTESGDVGGADIFYRQNINKMSMGTAVSGGKLAFKSGAGVETMVLDNGSVGINNSTNLSNDLGTLLNVNNATVIGNNTSGAYFGYNVRYDGAWERNETSAVWSTKFYQFRWFKRLEQRLRVLLDQNQVLLK